MVLPKSDVELDVYDADEVSQIRPVDVDVQKTHTVGCRTPLGIELVESNWLEEPTRVLSAAESRALVKELKKQVNSEANRHHRLTVRDMRVVKEKKR